MKSAEDMVFYFLSTRSPFTAGLLIPLLQLYGEEVKEECAKIAGAAEEFNWEELGEKIRKLELK